jgi:signal peptidase II
LRIIRFKGGETAVFWAVTAIVTAIDHAAKLIAQNAMTPGEQIVVLKGVLELRFTHNTGMALGFLSEYTAAGFVLPLLAVAAGYFILRRYRLSRFVLVASGLIVGGFLGNFLDRIIRGHVVDLFYFPWLPYFICNAADIAITFGALLITVSLICRPKDWRPRNPGGATDDQNPDG